MALLSVKNLSVGFFDSGVLRPVVDRVSFTVEHGEVLALVGESGCGKSASCLALTSLLGSATARWGAELCEFETSSGETVDLFKLPLRRLRKIRGREIAYVFQEPSSSLNPVFRIGDQIAEVLELHRGDVVDRRAETVKLLRDVGIPEPETRLAAYPHELSGGMQQRVMIAMALAGNPALLIADEPTTALDVTIQAQILELLDKLRRSRRMAVILVTHNLGIVSQLADRVAVMYAGRIVETAAVRQLIDRPRHPYSSALLAAVPRLGGGGGRLATIPGRVPSPAEFPVGCRFFGRCPVAAKLGEPPDGDCALRVPDLRELDGVAGHCCACWHVGGNNL